MVAVPRRIEGFMLVLSCLGRFSSRLHDKFTAYPAGPGVFQQPMGLGCLRRRQALKSGNESLSAWPFTCLRSRQVASSPRFSYLAIKAALVEANHGQIRDWFFPNRFFQHWFFQERFCDLESRSGS